LGGRKIRKFHLGTHGQSHLEWSVGGFDLKTFPPEKKMSKGQKLHIGCANVAPADWINLDGSWNAWAARYPVLKRVVKSLGLVPEEQSSIPWPKNILVHDVRKGLPFPEESLSAIYASHLLEHLYFEEARQLLRECFRVLESGGVIRLVVPNLQVLVGEYLRERDSEGPLRDSPGDRLCRRLAMRPPQQGRGHLLYRLYSSVKDFHTHKWMYDGESLGRHMSEAGFVSIFPKAYLESAIAGIEEVERKERFDNHRGICLEGMKPLGQCAP
jgi:predicted SAM-dependent methyltransferase